MTRYFGCAFAIALAIAWPPARAAEHFDVRTLPGGPFEASGATRLPGGDGVLFIDDGRPGHVFWLSVPADGGTIGEVHAVPLGAPIADPEGITNDGTWVYVVGSQSRGGKRAADLVRFRYDARERRVSDLQSLTGLAEMLHAVTEIAAEHGKKRGALNIEGLAWDERQEALLLGVRAPLIGGDALVVPLSVTGTALAPGAVKVGAARRVALGGRGIRSIEQTSQGFLIVAGGSVNAGQFSLYLWRGAGAARLVADCPAALKPEGVADAGRDGRMRAVLVGDSGHYALLDTVLGRLGE